MLDIAVQLKHTDVFFCPHFLSLKIFLKTEMVATIGIAKEYETINAANS